MSNALRSELLSSGPLTICIAFISIFSAVVITMIAVGIEVPGKGKTAYTLWPAPASFASAFLSVTNIVFAYGKYIDPSGEATG